jgi:hypothetical protein
VEFSRVIVGIVQWPPKAPRMGDEIFRPYQDVSGKRARHIRVADVFCEERRKLHFLCDEL